MTEQEQKECREAFEAAASGQGLPLERNSVGTYLCAETDSAFEIFKAGCEYKAARTMPAQPETEETDCDHCANPAPTESMLFTDAGTFCPSCIESWNPHRTEDKAEVVDCIQREIAAFCNTLPPSGASARVLFSHRMELARRIAAALPQRDDIVLVERVARGLCRKARGDENALDGRGQPLWKQYVEEATTVIAPPQAKARA